MYLYRQSIEELPTLVPIMPFNIFQFLTLLVNLNTDVLLVQSF